MYKAIKTEAAKFGVRTTFIGPPSFSPSVEYQEIDAAAVTKKYAGLVVVPIDGPSLAPAVEAAIRAGIKVATAGFAVGANALSTKIQVPGLVGQVIENLRTDATDMGKGVVSACKGIADCQVEVLWGDRQLSWDKVKPPFFYAALRGHSNIHLVCQSDALYTEVLGTNQTAACLEAHPALSVIASQSDYTTLGAVKALETANKLFGNRSGIKIVSSYGAAYGIAMVRHGLFEQTWYNRPASMGAAALLLVLDAIEGKPVPRYVNQANLDTVPTVITPAVAKRFPRLRGEWSF